LCPQSVQLPEVPISSWGIFFSLYSFSKMKSYLKIYPLKSPGTKKILTSEQEAKISYKYFFEDLKISKLAREYKVSEKTIRTALGLTK